VTSLFEKRLILVLGKGGVGRSTVAAALAASTARKGRQTLLYETNAKDRYSQFFEAPEVGGEPTQLRPNLYAVNTDPGLALKEYGLMVLRFERVYKLVFENRLTKYFLRAIPGLDDYALLGKAWFHTTETKRGKNVWDTLVFDMPASGHALSMLKLPSVILEAVPEGPLTRDARKLRDLLLDKRRTAIVMVTLAEEMPSNEATEVTEFLRDELGLDITHLVINQVHPDHFPHGSPAARVLAELEKAEGLDAELADLTAHGALGRSRRELNERYLSVLANNFTAPSAQLPYLFTPLLGPDNIDILSGLLSNAWP
jgi:anion-transporting  ArsA/GET3 family ATPase